MQLRKCFLDIEVLQEPNVLPLPEIVNRPVICVTLYDSYSQKYFTIVQRQDFVQHIEKENFNKTVLYTDSEESMFKLLWKLIAKLFPDIYIGHNVWYDLDYLINRSNKLKIPTFIAKTNDHIYGALVLDFKRAYEEFYTQTSYDLDNILKMEGFGGKQTDVKKLPEYYKDNIPMLIKHNRDEDVEGLVLLDEKLNLTDLLIMVKQDIAGFNNIEKSGYDENIYEFSQILDTVLLRLAYGNDVLLSKPKEGYKSYAGAVVFEPKAGIHRNVAVFDMEKFYPSIYKTLYTELCNKKDLTPQEQRTKKILQYIVKMYDFLAQFRALIEKEMKKYEAGITEYSRLEHQRQRVKDLTNAIYGFAGYKKSRIRDYPLAEKITADGRGGIIWSDKEFQKRGYEKIYGDTDSIFIQLRTENLEQEALQLAEEVSKTLTVFVKQELGYNIPEHKLALGVDKIFSSIIFVETEVKGKKKTAKKRYSGTIVWKGHYLDKPYNYTRGFEFVRRDQSILTKKTQGKALELVNKVDVEATKKLISQTIKDFKNDKFDIDEIAINQTIGKRFEDYKVNTSTLKGVKWSNKYLNANIVAGAMVKQIFVKQVMGYPHTNVICYIDKTMLPKFVLDKDRMIERTLKSPLEKVIKLLGITWNECIGDKPLLASYE